MVDECGLVQARATPCMDAAACAMPEFGRMRPNAARYDGLGYLMPDGVRTRPTGFYWPNAAQPYLAHARGQKKSPPRLGLDGLEVVKPD